MYHHLENPFHTDQQPARTGTAEFLDALGDPQAADAYREAMWEDATPSTAEGGQEPLLIPEELARLEAIQDRERAHELVELRKREYLEWAQEFRLGDDDPEQWIDETFTFNPDGTVEVDGDLSLISKNLTRLPRGLTRVNGYLILSHNQLTSLEGLPSEIHRGIKLQYNLLTSLEGLPSKIHGSLYLGFNQLTSLEGLPREIHGGLELGDNPLTSLEGLHGRKINGTLSLINIPATSISRGINLAGAVVVRAHQTALKADAKDKGYDVRVER